VDQAQMDGQIMVAAQELELVMVAQVETVVQV
jgi:hypothetical protein